MYYEDYNSMQDIINRLVISSTGYSFIDNDANKKNVIENLSKMNIIVGENNSGKSRFLRQLMNNPEMKFTTTSNNIHKLNSCISDLANKFNTFLTDEKLTNSSVSKALETIIKLEQIEFIQEKTDYTKELLDIKGYIEGLINSTNITIGYRPAPEIGNKLLGIFQESCRLLEAPLEDLEINYSFMRIYIPILRGLRPLVTGHQDVYHEITINDYKINQETVEIFTGLNLGSIIRQHLLGNYKQRQMVADFETFLSLNFFDGKKITLISEESGSRLRIKIGDEKEQYIHDLGDGIQSIIILTFQLFRHRDKRLVLFIEEPEQLLHPGLQRKLIDTLLNYTGFQTYQYFFTTHSNHFLDITLDFNNKISIYTIKKELDENTNDEKIPKFVIQNLSSGDKNLLKLLGVNNSSVFLSNCTIWVEGITDRLYFRHYLSLYQKYMKGQDQSFIEFNEDCHYSFVEYSGSNITHWSFLNKVEKPINVERLCGTVFLIADRDENKEARHKALKKFLGQRFCLLSVIEVENLLKKEVLLQIIKMYEKVDELDCTYFNEEDYKNVPLGKFIEEKILKIKNRIGSYQDNSGCISDKPDFCEKSIECIKKWDDLSQDAQEITKKIYDFIKSQNISTIIRTT